MTLGASVTSKHLSRRVRRSKHSGSFCLCHVTVLVTWHPRLRLLAVTENIRLDDIYPVVRDLIGCWPVEVDQLHVSLLE